MRNLSHHQQQLQKPAALLNLSMSSQESDEVHNNTSMERRQNLQHRYRSPQRCLRSSTPTPAVSPLVSAYPLSRRGQHHQGHHRHMMNGSPGSSEKSIRIRPFPSLEGSPLSLSSDSTQSSWSAEDLRSFRGVKKVLNLEDEEQQQPASATTTKAAGLALGSDSVLIVTTGSSLSPIGISLTPSPKKRASSKHDTPDTGSTSEPSDASSPATQSPSTGLNTPVSLPIKKTLFRATVHQTEESDEVEIILDARSPEQSNLLDLHEHQQQRPASPETPLTIYELPSSPSRLLDLCGFSVQDWCNSNHCALAATCETACGSHHASTSPGDDSTQQHMQSSICVSLGTMDGLCQPWQVSFPPRSVTQNKQMYHRHHTTKRRNLDLHKRRAHLNSLRRDLNPFTNMTTAASERQRYPFSKSQSFNRYSSPPSKASKPKDGKTTPTTTTGLPLVWACGGFSSANHDSPAAIRLQWEDECQGYDSDPEDYSPRRSSSSNKENNNSVPTPQINDDSTLEEFLNSRSTLILHEKGKSVAVHVWVELGQRLHNQTILPKLVWRPCRDSFKAPTERMDLLDICRIRPPTSGGVDRTRYPFARTDRILQIHSVRGPVVTLEARSTSERDRWMTLSKLAVSVFAAQLLTNDPTALTLFFVDSEAAVGPGEEPLLWQQQPSKPQQPSSSASHKVAWV